MAFSDLTEGVLEEFAERAQPPLGEQLPALPPEGFHVIRIRRGGRRYGVRTEAARKAYWHAHRRLRHAARNRAIFLSGQRPKYRTALAIQVAKDLGIDWP
jgi:hypothetical protein